MISDEPLWVELSIDSVINSSDGRKWQAFIRTFDFTEESFHETLDAALAWAQLELKKVREGLAENHSNEC